MNSDDTGEWLTYAEAGQRLGISTAAARQLSRRRNWPRRTPNEYGAQALVQVPAEALERWLKLHTDGVRMENGVRDTDEAAFALLARQLDREQERADRAERQIEIERQRVDELLHHLAEAPERGPGTDPMTAIGVQTLSQAVEMLREDVDRERDRADRAERQVEAEQQLVEEGRKRIDDLLIEVADARSAAMISGADAAALRTQLTLLAERRPWWRRWFR